MVDANHHTVEEEEECKYRIISYKKPKSPNKLINELENENTRYAKERKQT